MSSHFWSFLAGAATLLAIQWLAYIPSMRKHRMIMSLIARAKIYQQRAVAMSEAGRDGDAIKAWAECKTLMAQVDELMGKNK